MIVGIFLTPGEFGIYATALGILGLTAFMRAGGSATYLPSMRPEEFRKESGRLFGWGLLCISAGAAITSLVAEPIAASKHQPMLAWVLYILAARNLISVVGVQARMRMAVDLRFRELAVLDTINALIKMGLSCGLAWWLHESQYAVLALAIPYGVPAIIEALYCVPASGITLDELTPRPKRIVETAKQLRWSFALAALISINSQTNFLVISTFIPVAAVGLIYFAFQLASQPMTLLSSGLVNVFAPTMARERGNPAVERDTLQRVFSGAMLLVPFVFFGAMALYPSAETLIYRGRWAAAHWPFVFLAAGLCFATVCGVLAGSLVGLRQFKTLAGFEAMRALGLIGGTFVGYAICVLAGLELDVHVTSDAPPNPDLLRAILIVSAATAAGVALMACAQLWLVMRRNRMGMLEFLRALTFGPGVALLTMIAAESIGNSVAISFVPDDLHPITLAALKFILIGTTFTAITIVCVRFLAEDTLRRTVDVLPKGVRPMAARVLRFDESPNR